MSRKKKIGRISRGRERHCIMKNRPVRVAVAGIGGYGDQYVAALLEKGHEHSAILSAVVDPDPSLSPRLQAIKERKTPVFEDMAGALRDSPPDIFVLATPIHHHEPMTVACLEKGVSVLCEKPLCATIQEALRMLEAQQHRPGRFVSVGYQWSFSPTILSLREDISAGLMGRPLELRTVVLWPRKRSYYSRNSWAGALRLADGLWVLDSPAHNATAHYLHNMFFVLRAAWNNSSAPAEVSAFLARANPITNYDTAAMRIRTADGTTILFYSTHAVRDSVGPMFLYRFEQADVLMDSSTGGHIVARWHDGRTKDYGDPNSDQMEKLWRAVLGVRDNAPQPCAITDAVPQVLTINGAHDSMQEIAVFSQKQTQIDKYADGDQLVWVEGLAEAMLGCWQHSAMPGETDNFDWPARVGTPVRLTDYRWFPGGKQPQQA